MENKRVLIVEDESIPALELKMRLTRWNYHVVRIVSSGKEAIDAGQNEKLDLIIMDIFLDDDIDGINAVIEIHKTKAVPVIYVTASDDLDTYNRAQMTAYVDYIVKPYMPELLLQDIEKAIN